MMTAKARILVVDDHEEMARLLADQLRDAGYLVEVAFGGQAALAAAAAQLPDLVIADLRMEQVDGFDVLAGIKQHDRLLPVLIMTAFGAIDTAIEAMRRGADHYLTKPFQLREVLLHVERALAERCLRQEHQALKQFVAERRGLGAMVGRSKAMCALFALIERVAPSDVPVLIRGESGTGKELVARTVHALSLRQGRSFVAVNCTALPEALLESELFGHVKGAFTGATSARRGLFLEADGGTLFLDEIGDMPPALQARLLRVLEDGEVRAVGADGTRAVNVRIIAATHRALEDAVADGHFREDLFYRLNVVPLCVPPLRDRVEDIPSLASHLLAKALEAHPGSPVTAFSAQAITVLSQYRWPGNVRELENLVKRLVLVCGSTAIRAEDITPQFPVGWDAWRADTRTPPQFRSLREITDDYIAWVVEQCGGNKTQAAQILGIDVSTIHRRGKDRLSPRLR